MHTIKNKRFDCMELLLDANVKLDGKDKVYFFIIVYIINLSIFILINYLFYFINIVWK